MDTTTYRRRAAGRGSRTASRRRSGLPLRERRRLIQLAASAGLFLLVFFGRGIFPKQMAAWKSILSADVDFRGAVAQLGENVSDGTPVLEALEVFWADMTGQAAEPQPSETGGQASLPSAARPVLPGLLERAYHPAFGDQPAFVQQVRDSDEMGSGTDEPEEDPVVTAVAQQYTADGVTLPENVSLQYYNLGLDETVVPVVGTITSPFGFRDHPVSGDYLFHNAVDIGVKAGTDVLAYADGTVRYIGENSVYGLYVKLDHANGVSTFYAHCEKLLVKKGETVKCGQVIAKSGETGNATGPHLHFSVEKDGVRLNPAYYLGQT